MFSLLDRTADFIMVDLGWHINVRSNIYLTGQASSSYINRGTYRTIVLHHFAKNYGQDPFLKRARLV